MLTASRWAANSQVFAANISSDTMHYVYACMITATLILIHSASINKFKITTIRFWTDGSCWSTIFASICIILGILYYRQLFSSFNIRERSDTRNSNTFNDAFYIDLCVYAIFGTTVQLCDNYMTFSRYLIVYPKTSTRFKATVNLYIWLFLILTYLPYETILPCFVDTNSDQVSSANTITAGYIFMISYLSYNLFFSYKFWKAMQYKNSFGGGSNRKLLILGAKNILHIFISSIGVVLQGIEFNYGFAPAGCMTSYLTVNIALHFLFNWKIEKVEFPFKPNNFHSSSAVVAVPSLVSNRMSRFERGMSSMISSVCYKEKDRQLSILSQSIKFKIKNRSSNTGSMFVFGGLSIKNDRSESQRALVHHHQSPRLQEEEEGHHHHLPVPITHISSKDSHIYPSTTTIEKLIIRHQSSRDSYRIKDTRGSHILRNSLKEEGEGECEGKTVEEIENVDVDIAHKQMTVESTLRRTMSFVITTMFVNKVHVDNNNSLINPHNPNSNTNHYHNNNINENSNRQQRHSLTATTTTATPTPTMTSSMFKRKESDFLNHPIKIVKVTERKLTM